MSTNPVSPYGAFNGQVRSCVYQPTEIALIAKGLTKVSVWPTSHCSPLTQPHVSQMPVHFCRWSKKAQWSLVSELHLWIQEAAAPCLAWMNWRRLKNFYTAKSQSRWLPLCKQSSTGADLLPRVLHWLSFPLHRQGLCVDNWNWKDSAAFNRPGISNCPASSRPPLIYDPKKPLVFQIMLHWKMEMIWGLWAQANSVLLKPHVTAEYLNF